MFVISTFVGPNKKEGFEQASDFIVKKGNDVYDDFYCSIYDDLVYDEINDFEVVHLKRTGKIDDKSNVIEVIGSGGRGHHVNHYNSKGIKAEGLDISPSMVKLAQQEYPNSKFKLGMLIDSSNFQYDSASHILCCILQFIV